MIGPTSPARGKSVTQSRSIPGPPNRWRTGCPSCAVDFRPEGCSPMEGQATGPEPAVRQVVRRGAGAGRPVGGRRCVAGGRTRRRRGSGMADDRGTAPGSATVQEAAENSVPNLADRLRRAVIDHGDRPALHRRDTTLDWSELDASVTGVAHALSAAAPAPRSPSVLRRPAPSGRGIWAPVAQLRAGRRRPPWRDRGAGRRRRLDRRAHRARPAPGERARRHTVDVRIHRWRSPRYRVCRTRGPGRLSGRTWCRRRVVR